MGAETLKGGLWPALHGRVTCIRSKNVVKYRAEEGDSTVRKQAGHMLEPSDGEQSGEEIPKRTVIGRERQR